MRIVGLLVLVACKMNDPKHHAEVAPAPPTCGPPAAPFALQDEASLKLVANAKPSAAATIEITTINKPDYGCNTGGFGGWEATARITGGDYELVGIVSYPPATEPIARGAHDEWVTFPVEDPGYGHELHVGAVWRSKKGAATPIVVGAVIPARQAPPPPPPDRTGAELGCDPASPWVALGPPLNTDRAIHVGFATIPEEHTLPSQVALAIWLDKDTLGDPNEIPIVTTELGTVTRAGPAWDNGLPPRSVVFALNGLCPDLRVLARRFTVNVSWKIDLDASSKTYATKIVLEQKADGSIVRSGS